MKKLITVLFSTLITFVSLNVFAEARLIIQGPNPGMKVVTSRLETFIAKQIQSRSLDKRNSVAVAVMDVTRSNIKTFLLGLVPIGKDVTLYDLDLVVFSRGSQHAFNCKLALYDVTAKDSDFVQDDYPPIRLDDCENSRDEATLSPIFFTVADLPKILTPTESY